MLKYTLSDHRKMSADAERVLAYAEALRRAIRPGAVVVDIGTGTGTFALLACQAGARRVYAIEPDDVIEVAWRLARANRCDDCITFIQDISQRVTLPERADVIVSDLRGVLPWSGEHVPTIIDARTRLLASGGTLIPSQDTLWAALVEDADLYHSVAAPWDEARYGLDFTAVKRLATNTWSKAWVMPRQLLALPQCLARIDYAEVDDVNLSAEATWIVDRDAVLHGICAWFDAILLEGVGFSNAPGQRAGMYGCGFFPLDAPTPLAKGDRVWVGLRADLVGQDYVWRWDTRVSDGEAPDQAKAVFAQSNFAGTPFSFDRISR